MPLTIIRAPAPPPEPEVVRCPICGTINYACNPLKR